MVSQGLNRRLTPDVDTVLRRQQDPALLFATQPCPPLAGAWARVGEPILDGGCLLDLHVYPARPVTDVELNNLELVYDGDGSLRIQSCSTRQAFAGDLGPADYRGEYFIFGRSSPRDKDDIKCLGIAGRRCASRITRGKLMGCALRRVSIMF